MVNQDYALFFSVYADWNDCIYLWWFGAIAAKDLY